MSVLLLVAPRSIQLGVTCSNTANLGTKWTFGLKITKHDSQSSKLALIAIRLTKNVFQKLLRAEIKAKNFFKDKKLFFSSNSF